MAFAVAYQNTPGTRGDSNGTKEKTRLMTPIDLAHNEDLRKTY